VGYRERERERERENQQLMLQIDKRASKQEPQTSKEEGERRGLHLTSCDKEKLKDYISTNRWSFQEIVHQFHVLNIIYKSIHKINNDILLQREWL
jgi:hypothetical protein